MEKLRILMPKGSLNNPKRNRGNTFALWEAAGYDLVGYDPGCESESELRVRGREDIWKLYITRPQDAPLQLMIDMMTEVGTTMADVGITGSDWAKEVSKGKELVNKGKELVKLADLEYGKTRLVFGIPESIPQNQIRDLEEFVSNNCSRGILCYTEYPNIAADAIASTKAYKRAFGDQQPLKILDGNVFGDNSRVRVVMTNGATEGFIERGANIILDNSSSGAALKEYNLRELAQVMTSSACLYASEKAMEDPWKYRQITLLGNSLLSVVDSRKSEYITFDVPLKKRDAVLEYITKEGLFTDSITEIPSASNPECRTFNLLIPTAKWDRARDELPEYGAVGLVRINQSQVIPCQRLYVPGKGLVKVTDMAKD